MPAPCATALLDQIHAATRDARTLLGALAQQRRERVEETLPPLWLLAQRQAFVTALMTGQGRFCPHLGASPQPAFTAAWAPGALTCAACFPSLKPDPVEDRTCDHCRTEHPTLHNCLAAFGPILMAYGLCPACMTLLHPAPDDRQ